MYPFSREIHIQSYNFYFNLVIPDNGTSTLLLPKKIISNFLKL